MCRIIVMPLVFLMLGLSPLAVQASTSESPVSEYMLKNGMKVLVKQDHRAPVVVSQVWYKVGASYEHNGITGVSHVLEHMMFKGTEKHPAGEFSKIIAANGGRENAFTGRDYTAYFQQLEKSRLEISFEMEADRMRNLTLPDDHFKKELAVVIEERQMRTEDKPRSLTYEKFNATAYTNSPYGQPIIGWMDDLKNLTVDDLKPWYARWYSPNNATLVVAGDVNPEEVLKLAEKHFANIPPSDLKPLKPRTEEVQKGPRKVTVRVPAKLPYMLMGYKVPVLKTAAEEWEPYALEVLSGILSGGSSARFPKELVRKQQIAVSVDVGYNLYARQSELFLIDATPSAEHSVDEVKQAVDAQLENIKANPVSDEELQRIKAQVVASAVYERDSIFYQAMQLGTLETVGLGWQRMDEYVDKVRAVTAEQIQQVAKKYFIEDSLTVAVLEPQPIDPQKMPQGSMSGSAGHH
ncbi:MAG: insulinase family protein [Gammaproteobacteria bacterium]|nr:insulinase family protein [Gammaproteobacteria bacterium]